MARKLFIVFRIVVGVFSAVVLYFIFSIVISEHVFPAEKPDVQGYFKPGDRLASKFEGFDQTVLAVNGGWLHTRLEVRPGAVGPPEHFHEKFSETFTVNSGTLSILLNGEKRTLRAGETLTIPPMTRHKPFNETNETVVVESDDPRTIPLEFGYILSQLYGFMDEHPGGPSTRQMILQLSVHENDADTWIADGPSLNMQKAMRVLLKPTARVLGYKNYYEQYRPRR